MIDEIQVEKTGGGVAELVLNRPAKHNAITPAMSAAIREALKSLESDGEVRCVLVRGAGERSVLRRHGPSFARRFRRRMVLAQFDQLCARVQRFS